MARPKSELFHGKAMLAREAMLRHCHDRNAPGVRVMVDVIAGAIHETAYKTRSEYVKKADRKAAEAFLAGDHAMTAACELAGLEPHFVRYVAERVKAT